MSERVRVPEQGQLAQVRSRLYVVTEASRSSLQFVGGEARQHLVTLRSVEDDALGEELQVIWELEVGAMKFERLALPAPVGFDTPATMAAFLNAIRWGAIAQANVRTLQAPFRSGIDIEPYQLDPVVRALEMPRVNLLIADDVGLGKTIEAGLVAQELLIRHRARRMLVVCPAGLQIQWRDQMRDKFGLQFRIVDRELMKRLRRERGIHVNPWSHFPRLITSIDYLKRERPLRLLRELLPAEGEVTYPRRFDLLIVDEAHHVAPSGRGKYALDSQRTQAIRLLTPHFEHKLFLSATPHNGYAESFSALLELLDNQRFARGVPPDEKQLAQVMVRRLKSELPPRWDGTPRFPTRQLQAILVSYTPEERQVHGWLQQYTESRRERANSTAEQTATEFVLKLLKKRLFSSPAAFAKTLAKHQDTLTKQADSSRIAAKRPIKDGVLRKMIEEAEEEYADDEAYEEATATVLRSTTRLFGELSAKEIGLLAKMSQWAERASSRRDSKARHLLAWIKEHLQADGQWLDERVIIFTEYRETQKWLQGLFAAAGLTTHGRLMVLYGGMDKEEREAIKAAFQAHPSLSPVRILLATDAASEGIDLQRHCNRLIHIEIPWNPNRMEQRNGRIDRHGQKKSPLIFHFAPKSMKKELVSNAPGDLEGDLEFLMRAVQKVEQIREDLGKVGPVIADQVRDAMLGSRRYLDTKTAEQEARTLRSMLRFERELQKRIERLHEKLLESRKTLNLTPENVQSVVEIGLALAEQPPLQDATLPGVWPDQTGKRQKCPVFHLPPLRGSWARAAEGLAHPHTHQLRPIVFDHTLAQGRDDVVLAHLNHPLVQLALYLLRAEVWGGQRGQRSLNRVTAQVAPNLNEPVVIAHGRLVVIGGDSHRLHEEIISAGGTLRQGRFRRLTRVGDVQRALDAATMQEVSAESKARFQAFWPKISDSLDKALGARMRDRTESLQTQLQRRADKEIQDMKAILEELRRTILQELERSQQYVQLELDLFSTAEREQYHRNISALKRRLAQIPHEIEQEAAQIRIRYANPQPRLFPVAVTFLLPQKLA